MVKLSQGRRVHPRAVPGGGEIAPGADAKTALARTGFDLSPIRLEGSRLERVTVCTRPFRAGGPRIEPERIGEKLVVHNYGHGGSGWSLSWGSAAQVVRLALSGVARDVAVIGCGALGLTAALALQRAGGNVRIYAQELPPAVRSSRATGLWSPDSRVGLSQALDEAAEAGWERIARTSWAEFGAALKSAGSPIDFHSRYLLSDLAPDEEIAERYRKDQIGFAHLEQRLSDLYAAPKDFGPGSHPFPTRYCRELTTLRFNITAYSQQLLHEFHQRGGRTCRRVFQTTSELASIPEPVVVNCTGYGARALLHDASILPVRGQIGWLPAQPAVRYSLQWARFSMVSRADGMVVQMGASSDDTGWMDAGEEPDRKESEAAVQSLAELLRGCLLA